MSDLIERQAAIDALHTRFRDGFDGDKWWNSTHVLAAIEGLPSAEPERKKPDHGYMWICPECGLEVHSDFRRCVRCGWDRPNVERKTGRWIKHKDRSCWYCSECNVDDYYAYNWDCDSGEYKFQDNYCPNCGADMRGGEDETD